MTHNNLLHEYNWDVPYEDPQNQNQNSRQQDEVISVYEIFVKDEDPVDNNPADGKNDPSSSILTGILGSSTHADQNQLIQGNCAVELDKTLESVLMGPPEISVEKLCEKEALKYKILEENNEEKFLPYSSSHPINRNENPPVIRLVDKDDPRSRLHFVKYLKREGKTLKIWECGICSKEFRHQYTLMRHLPTHTDERNFKCETCGKAFRQLSTLSQHRAIHSDARPYVCEYCKKTFNRVSTLISHRKTHSDDKPHKCQMCGKGFHQKGNLRNHVFTHTNERPYKCGLCGKGFNQMSNLMCHKIKSHANVERSLPYACTICGKKFLRRFALRSHEESKHGIKYSQTKSTTAINDNAVNAAAKNFDLGIPDFQNNGRIQVASIPTSDVSNADSVIIDSIQTKAMEDAVSLGQIPFALFKPTKGIPILVKVSPAASSIIENGKQILSPATAEDLKLAGKMCLNTITLTNDIDGVKAVQIKVPVVATVTQTLDCSGNFNYLIEAPGPDQDQESHLVETQFSYSELGDENHENPNARHPATVTLNGDEEHGEKASTNDLVPFPPDCDIQYIRATDDGRYEMMSNTEAIDLMAQNCHDVTVLNDVDVASISFDDQIGDSINNQSNLIRADKSLNLNHNIDYKNIEVFGDKDFRILGSREDRFSVDDISLLEQSKIEDFILGSRNQVNSNNMIIGDDHHHDDDDDGGGDGASFSGIDSSYRNHVDPNELQLFNRRQSAGMSFLHQLQNLG